MQEAIEQAPRSAWIEGRQSMETPEDVQAMLKLASFPFTLTVTCWSGAVSLKRPSTTSLFPVTPT